MTAEKYFYLGSTVSFPLRKVTYISIDLSQIVHSTRWVFIEMFFYLEAILMLSWIFSCLNFFLSRYSVISLTSTPFKYMLWNLKYLCHVLAEYFIFQFAPIYLDINLPGKPDDVVKYIYFSLKMNRIFCLVVSISSLFLVGFCRLYFLSLVAHVDPFEKWMFAKSSLSWKRR